MANTFSNSDGTLVIPGAYSSIKVLSNASSLAASGVIMLTGESDSGPDYLTDPVALENNFFGPDQASDVALKYKSGPIVDGFRAAISASNDPSVVGSPSRIYIAKTNPSTKASASLARSGLTAYGSLYDKSYGALGNQLYDSVSASVSEVAPTTGAATYAPLPQSSVLSLRVNGAVAQTLAIAAKTVPSTLVGSFGNAPSGLNSLTGVYATGGVDRLVLTGISATSSLAFTHLSATTATITLSGAASAWGVLPQVGDTLLIPANGEYGSGANSVIWSAADRNAGAYIVTSVSNTVINVTKLAHDTTNAYTLTDVGAAAISATPANDLKVFSPVVLNHVTGTDRGLLTGLTTKNVTLTAATNTLAIVLATGQVWNALPQVGDYLFIPATSAYVGGTQKNSGWYTVTSAGSGTGAGASFINVTRLNDGNTESVGATPIAAVADLQCIRPVIDGLGKVMSVTDGAGTANINGAFYTLTGAGAKVAWLATTNVQTPLVSASEYKASLSVNRQSDAISETWVAGGEIALLVGYAGTTGTMQITATQAIFTVTGGSGASFTVNLSAYSTINDLAAYISAQTGYTAKAFVSTLGQLNPLALDEGTYGICSNFAGHTPGRVKKDAFQFFKILSASGAVQLGNPAVAANSGLPEVQATTFLSGGARGASANSNITGAMDALAKVQGNFLVPLFSRDATLDIADGLTDSGSTYTIDSINAYAKSHVLAMSTVKKRRNRQAFCSKKDTFINAKIAAGNLASNRVSVSFQDVKNIASDGSIKQFQPWMGACLAAGMQAAGFYKAIFNKGINCSGVLQAAGDFSDQDDSQMEDALLSGLLPMKRRATGGFSFVSDQTTYAIDNNFVYNSIQMNSILDIIALTSAQRFEVAFVGQSLGDVSAAQALSFLQGVMADFLRLKLISVSDDAPKGFRDAIIKINGNVMTVSLSVRPAGAIYFVPIQFTASAVTQTAS